MPSNDSTSQAILNDMQGWWTGPQVVAVSVALGMHLEDWEPGECLEQGQVPLAVTVGEEQEGAGESLGVIVLEDSGGNDQPCCLLAKSGRGRWLGQVGVCSMLR
jgi:hypothetical protein